MRVAFRADASVQIGTGHIMRCLTLADALAARGAHCLFLCRAHDGNLIDFIHSKGHQAISLPVAHEAGSTTTAFGPETSGVALAHGHWLVATQAQDAEACAAILAPLHLDWLIVDHYSLDVRWEGAMAPHCRKLMVIDDLADRFHICDLLLDQTFGRSADDYRPLVPENCELLCGSEYALLRPEFAALRPYSLQRRTHPILRELLITMGGVDKDNATGQVLQALRACALPADCRITVVMGGTAPWLDEVRKQSLEMPWPTKVLLGVSNMAQLMADSDLAIGAAGATSWERCCLGLPTAMVVLAENQRHAAHLLEQANAARMLDLTADFEKCLSEFINEMSTSIVFRTHLAGCASKITDGCGCQRVADWLTHKERE